MSKNERKTEDIVRDHFKKYADQLVLEEQSSDNPKIIKLLSAASKSGAGHGYPEFIIQYKGNPDLLIVIECKAEITKHESKNLNQPREYAVDGTLLYSAYLSRDFDVLSIGVSGENKSELKVSHFLQLKSERKAIKKFSNKLLSAEDYLQGYLKSPEKTRQDYENLLLFSKELNDKLHNLQIKEDLRVLLLSAILISLENEAFKKSYKHYTNPKQLADYLVQTTYNQFDNSGIEKSKIETLRILYNQLTVLDGLIEKIENIRDLIIDIDKNISEFIKTHEYFDFLGQLYIEFLRYANSDKGLGIVLTPPHITEFMSELGEVNKDSVVYDSCTGTGGFLVSAMNLMIKDAKGDSNKIKEIKQKQLIGVENKAHIFALACSNMFIHQDGKTNILNGNCFDKNIIEKVKTKNPTVGLLNPPYKSNKKKDTEELEFILNNLECIEQGGKCVAIVPMSSVLAQKGKILELKKKLLEQHTLEAVFSMPDELFFNSDVNVVACIIIFTAKRPHPKNKKTFFGYFKDDGFVKRKIKGRVDAFGRWSSIKEQWIESYMNKEDIAGMSVNNVVTAKDEWCAEAYMETDHSVLSNKIFSDNILKYASFEFSNRIIFSVSDESFGKGNYLINTKKWNYFNLVDLFKISASRDELMDYLIEGNKTPYVTSSDSNNGVTSYVEEDPTNPAGTITANRGGSVGYFYYQPIPYKTTPVDVRILTPKFKINTYVGLFIKTILQLEKYRFNYSRKMGSDRLTKFRIKLPVKDGQPDWQFMEDYIKSLPYSAEIK